MRKVGAFAGNLNFSYTVVIWLDKNAFAFTIKDTRLGTTGGWDLKQNKYVGQFPTTKRLLTSTDGNLISYFDQIDETEGTIPSSSLKQTLNIRHDLEANKLSEANYH